MDGKPTAKNLTRLNRCKTLSYELPHENCLACQRNNYAQRRVKMRQLRKPKVLPEQQNNWQDAERPAPRKTVWVLVMSRRPPSSIRRPALADCKCSRDLHFVCGWADYRVHPGRNPELLGYDDYGFGSGNDEFLGEKVLFPAC